MMDYMAAQMDSQIEGAISENERLRQEIERLQAIEAAARNLVKVKGRYHTEQAFKSLVAALETKT
jgi:hypothetical protein